MKFDHNMSDSEFIDLTLDLGYWFPWRLCASPFFREKILGFLESEDYNGKIKDFCNSRHYNFVHVLGKNGQQPSKEDCQKFKDMIFSTYSCVVDSMLEEKKASSDQV